MGEITLLLGVCVVVCVTGVGSRPPEALPSGPVEAELQRKPSDGLLLPEGISSFQKFDRLPGVCRRLKRRRITILCNVEKFCSVLRDSDFGQICRCPKASRCSHFYLRSF